jgi:hypothetical protein
MIHYWLVHRRIQPIGGFGNAFILDRNQIQKLKSEREAAKQ